MRVRTTSCSARRPVPAQIEVAQRLHCLRIGSPGPAIPPSRWWRSFPHINQVTGADRARVAHNRLPGCPRADQHRCMSRLSYSALPNPCATWHVPALAYVPSVLPDTHGATRAPWQTMFPADDGGSVLADERRVACVACMAPNVPHMERLCGLWSCMIPRDLCRGR